MRILLPYNVGNGGRKFFDKNIIQTFNKVTLSYYKIYIENIELIFINITIF